MMRRGVVILLERRREQKELAKVYDCIRRLVSVPDSLIEDVLGTDPALDRDKHDTGAGGPSGTGEEVMR